MSTEPLSAASELEVRFERLASEWQRETAHLSSPTDIARHPSYQAIVRIGESAIPLILRDLEATHSQWFQALRAITQESPVRLEDRGDVVAMTNAWLDWGKRRQYI